MNCRCGCNCCPYCGQPYYVRPVPVWPPRPWLAPPLPPMMARPRFDARGAVAVARGAIGAR